MWRLSALGAAPSGEKASLRSTPAGLTDSMFRGIDTGFRRLRADSSHCSPIPSRCLSAADR